MLTPQQVANVENTLRRGLRTKFRHYNSEPAVMPFHTRLLGKDRTALFSFIHSLSANFGTSIFEPVAKSLAESRFKVAKLQVVVDDKISKKAQRVIQDIMDDLTISDKPNKINEIEAVRTVCQKGKVNTVKPTKVDVWLENHSDELFLFDIKIARPSKGGFKESRRTLLEWIGCVLAKNPSRRIHVLTAMPYNPYEPKPYSRWAMAGMLDLDNKLEVAQEFWNFLAGESAYQGLLDCFEHVGIELHDEVDEYFKKFSKL